MPSPAFLLLALLLALETAGCAGRACEDASPSMQVTLELAAGLAPRQVATLRVKVSAAGHSKTTDLDIAAIRSSGRASFVAVVGSDGAGGFTADISVRALDDQGAPLAWADERFSATGDACNTFSLQLTTGAGDGGPPDIGPHDLSVPRDADEDANGDADGALPSWQTGPWSSCSAPCLGTQTRSVWCQREDGATVSDALCQGEKPATSQSCNGDCTYSWQTGAWSACTRSCGGGMQTRSVWCLRSDGATVGDDLCPGAKPAVSQSCNSQPCCATSTLEANRLCDGTERDQQITWDSNSGSEGDRQSCAAQCTAWASARGFTRWCCQLYEDSNAGTNWVCRLYDAYSSAASAGRFAGLGQCQPP